MIGKDSVKFNIQVEKKYTTTKGSVLNVDGVYVYTQMNSPIKLQGTLDLRTQKLLLHEIDNKKDSFLLNFQSPAKLISGIKKIGNSPETKK